MADQYTDRHGFPLTAAETLRRLQSPKSRGYYRGGRWVKLPAKATKPPAKPTTTRKEAL